MKTFLLGSFLLAGSLMAINAQGVSINFNKKHAVGGVDKFERSKYITIHAANYANLKSGGAQLMDYLITDLDVYYGRETGTLTGLTDHYPNISSQATIFKNNYKYNYTAHGYENSQELVVTGQERVYDAFVSAANENVEQAGTNYGDFLCDYLREACGTGGATGLPRPKYLEVLNEPLWYPIDQYVLWKTWDPAKPSFEEEQQILDDLFIFHRETAKEVHRQEPGSLVGGFAEAFPDPESRNWFNWETRWKRFIDLAGDEMDYYSFHLYDFNEPTEKFRKGGNVEALMDLLTHYNYLKWGEEKPFLITEYGARTRHIEDQKRNPERDWLCMSSINSLMVQFMDRPDMMEKTIPFIMAVWSEDWNIFNPDNGIAEYTDYIKFYELWKGVNGTRLYTSTSDLDIQVDAYNDGNKTYLIINNLENNPVTVNVSELGIEAGNIASTEERHLYWDAANTEVKLDINNTTGAPVSTTISNMATTILVYTTNETPSIDYTLQESRNYADKYLQEIVANTPISFSFNNLSLKSDGVATLKLSLGRNHGLSLQPIVKVNNTAVTVPTDFRGDTQSKRPSFFGMLDIDVPYNLLQKNNTVTVEFADAGGYVSSMVLRLYNQENGNSASINIKDAVNNSTQLIDVYPNPATDYLNIKMDAAENASYSVFNTEGCLMQTDALTSNSISIEDLDKGVYIINIESKNNVYTQRFVKLK